MDPAAAIRPLTAGDEARLGDAFTELGWSKPISLFQRYLAEQAAGTRSGLVATAGAGSAPR
ncbi:hypothetical protein GC722_00805 [Auraticoccus sp. F435]|uniref:GNAT family N-acetyltransferase n=1 Tax=Auraticoccus cholistanensis TaxID=2656650 RepID=A0A6A9UPH4_9ACTN|nr:hypothetical protein [Auraticoccus cholistanensis]MVA74581.1 hypothetical protein [Auraticoccus cholistanensis]